MSAQLIPYEDLAERIERDKRAFRLRLVGHSVKRIAEDLAMTEDEVTRSLTRMTGGISPELRTRTVEMELERLDAMQAGHFQKACEGSVESLNGMLKLMERRAKMLGLDAQNTAIDALQAALNANRETSTERILRAIEFVASQGGGTVIDGEAEEVK